MNTRSVGIGDSIHGVFVSVNDDGASIVFKKDGNEIEFPYDVVLKSIELATNNSNIFNKTNSKEDTMRS